MVFDVTKAFAAAVVLTMFGAAFGRAGEVPDYTWEKEIFVEMRDGIRLSTDILLPGNAPEKLPTVLIRTPYHKDNTHWVFFGSWNEHFLKNGYAVVIQSERGRHFSEGYYEDYLEGAKDDGYDTAEWIADQPWSNGKIGTFGCSSSAEHQWAMAAARHPAHAAMLPLASGAAIGDIPGNDTQGAIYRGGIPQLGLWTWWYHDTATSERLLLPPNTDQAQRIRLRNTFSLQPMTYFYEMENMTINPSKEKNVSLETFRVLPSKDAIRQLGGALTPFDKYITWTPGDPRWDAVNQARAGHTQVTPAIHLNTWYDIGVGEMIRMFKYLQDRQTPGQYLVIGSSAHCRFLNEASMKDVKIGDLELGDARYRGNDNGYRELFTGFFNRHLKGEDNGIDQMPKVQLHVMHKGWITSDAWPLPSTSLVKYYLDSTGEAGSRMRSGVLSTSLPQGAHADVYEYDPMNPVPARGGGCCGDAMAVDQRDIEARADVLTYTTPELEDGVTVAGSIEVVLYVSSLARDTDFMVKLIDVYPDGKAINLNDDGFRMRYREGFDKKVLMQEGDVYEIRLTNMVTANHFQPGHRIRLQVSSSNFPNYERNLNTGGNNYDETEGVVAVNSLHHTADYPSHVILPILPD